jgi:hypothetical protein
MPQHLSDDWLRLASETIAADPHMQRSDVEAPFVLQQIVLDPPPPLVGPVVWHVRVAPDGIRWHPGAHPSPDVTFTCDAETAWAVERGDESAQAAFMDGRLRIGGDAGVLVDNQAHLAHLHDALGPLRAETTR